MSPSSPTLFCFFREASLMCERTTVPKFSRNSADSLGSEENRNPIGTEENRNPICELSDDSKSYYWVSISTGNMET
jgi:hypothetical protein